MEYLPRIHHIAALQQSPRVLVEYEHREHFTGRIIFMSMFNDISWRSEDNEKECESSAQLVSLSVRNAQHVSLFAKIFGAGQWSFFGLGSEKKWYSTGEDSPQGEWDRIAEQMMLTFAESKHSVFRSTSPLSRGVQGVGVPKACVQQAAADSRGSRTCVSGSGGTRRGGRRMN